jgi:outer membrane protein TolC
MKIRLIGLPMAIPMGLLMALTIALFLAARAEAQTSGKSKSHSMPSAGMSPGMLQGDSVASGDVSPQPIALTIADAVQRALKTNLAILAGNQQERVASAERLRDLAELLPRINGRLALTQQQTNLAAYGFSGFPGVPQVIGPFSLIDARAMISQPVFDLKRRHDLRESTENEKAVSWTNENTRELVVFTTLGLYFQGVADASRVRAVEAQVATGEVLYRRAMDLRDAGVAPGIDVVRAQVELETRRQELIRARNDFSRQRLDLARVIGLPLAQEFTLTDPLPAARGASDSVDDSLKRAYADRADIKAAEARIRAAEEAVKAARSENLPTLHLDGDYGVTGRAPGNSHGTYSVSGSVRFPIFNSDANNDIAEKQANLDQRRAELASLRGHIEHDVRSADLEIRSAEEQIRVAESTLALVRQQLDQAQDRFAAGVASNLEVVQAQESLALADENMISGLFAFNAARAALAASMGVVERSVQELFGGNPKP